MGEQELKALLEEVQAALETHQPELTATQYAGFIRIEGRLITTGPDGPFDAFEVTMAVPAGYPVKPPIVWETGERIERTVERHIFPKDGNCCFGVWEAWLLTTPDRSFEAFLLGPLHSYFISQSVYEMTEDWPFGQRSHGLDGVVEAYCEAIGIATDEAALKRYLTVVAQNRPKGHHRCPCRSGKRLRACCMLRLEEMHSRITPEIARAMIRRIKVRHGVMAARPPVEVRALDLALRSAR